MSEVLISLSGRRESFLRRRLRPAVRRLSERLFFTIFVIPFALLPYVFHQKTRMKLCAAPALCRARSFVPIPRCIKEDRIEGGELRWQTLGLVGGIVLLLVAHTVRSEEQDESPTRRVSAAPKCALRRLAK